MKLGKIKETFSQWPYLNICDARSFSFLFWACLTYASAAQEETTLDNILFLVTESLPFSSIFSYSQRILFYWAFLFFQMYLWPETKLFVNLMKVTSIAYPALLIAKNLCKTSNFSFFSIEYLFCLLLLILCCVFCHSCFFFFNLLTDVSNVTSPVCQ